jgi:UDP-glucose 4-epimerase
MKRALVTGCAGFIGSEVTRQLLAAGYQVVGIDNLTRGTKAHLADVLPDSAFRFVRGDIRFREDLWEVFCPAPHYVFHLAARQCVPECVADPAGTYAVNIVGTQRVWEAAQSTGCRRFLFVSAGDVYRPAQQPHRESDPTHPIDAYGLSKLAAEHALSLAASGGGPVLVIARLFNVYGPGETNPHVLPAILEQVRQGARQIALGNLWPVRDLTFVRDVAEALIRVVEAPHPPDVVNVGSGAGWSVQALVQQIAEVTGRPIEAVSVPQKCRPVERAVLRPDISRLTGSTGWWPPTSLLEGLKRTIAASKEIAPWRTPTPRVERASVQTDAPPP